MPKLRFALLLLIGFVIGILADDSGTAEGDAPKAEAAPTEDSKPTKTANVKEICSRPSINKRIAILKQCKAELTGTQIAVWVLFALGGVELFFMLMTVTLFVLCSCTRKHRRKRKHRRGKKGAKPSSGAKGKKSGKGPKAKV